MTTSRRAAAAALADQPAFFRQVIDLSPIVMFVRDRAGRFLLANKAGAELFETSVAELEGTTGQSFYAPGEWERFQKINQGVMDTGREEPLTECAMVDSAGRVRRFLTSARPLSGPEGRTDHVLVVGVDITERHRAETRFRTLLESAPDAMVITDGESSIQLVNEQTQRLFGYTREELIGRPFEFLIPEAAGRAQLEAHPGSAERPAAGSFGLERELVARRKDGTLFPVAVKLAALQADGELLISAAIRDATDRRRAEQIRQELERNLLQTQKLEGLGVLAGGIAHDFNNVLTGILGGASIARLDLPDGHPALESLDTIEHSAQRAADLCRQLLAYSGRGRVVVQRVSPNRLIEDTVQLLNLSTSKKATLRFELASELPAIEVDPIQIQQVVMNLVINAAEAMEGARGEVRVRTSAVDLTHLPEPPVRVVAAAAPGRYVGLEVEDSGTGMPPEVVERSFDPFFTTKFTGRGLGLAAVLGIVRGHKGGLFLESALGKGTRIEVLLPASPLPAEDPLQKPTRPAFRAAGHVLVVDDEEAVRVVAERLLSSCGLEVECVADGATAIERVRSRPDGYRLMLLDLTMPHLDGGQTLLAVRQLSPALRVVLMSGYAEQEAQLRLGEHGIAGFLQKPFTAEAMLSKLKPILAG